MIEIKDFIDKHVSIVSERYSHTALSYFNAITSGKAEDFATLAQAELELEKLYTNKEDFQLIKKFKETPIDDPLLKRQIDVLFLSYQGKQADEKTLEKIIEIQNQIEQKFSGFRAIIDWKIFTDNQIEEILSTSKDSEEVEKARIASKAIGPVVVQDVLQIVALRNETAKELWYKNYHDMSLRLSEQDPEHISVLFDKLDELTRDAFANEKKNIDKHLAEKFGIIEEELMPRHYQNRYFQEAPKIYQIDLDVYYKDQDIVELSRGYYESLKLPVESILEASDLYERESKYQHACCIDINKTGDVRIVCNIKSNAKWMNTQLHELWHAVYDKFADPTTPYLLREPAHIFTTESIAMLFGRFASNPQRIQDILHISEEEKQKIADACFHTLRLEQLVFSRRAQVMYRFEKQMYENPDQDLNTLRRDLVEKYQMIKRPAGRNEPDRATKIHIATSPCYYHNYLLGELLASQLYYYIVWKVLKSSDYRFQSFYNQPEVGEYLKKNIFYPGSKYHWDTMIELATGERLTPKWYAKQFVG